MSRGHDKANKMTCVPSIDMDQPGHDEEVLGPKLPIKRTMKNLIRLARCWVLAGSTGCWFGYAAAEKWSASWQNQQSECMPSEDSDRPGHPPSLIRVFAVRIGSLATIKHTVKTLIRLGRCSGWSESSLGAQPHCLFCHEAAQILFEICEKTCWYSFIL